MASKRLNMPTANFGYAVNADRPKQVGPAKRFPTKNRVTKKPQHQESWKDDLPAYQYQTKMNKSLALPEKNDNILGGYSNIGNMSMKSAQEYMKQRKKQEEREKEKEAAKQRRMDPFANMFNESEADNDKYL